MASDRLERAKDILKKRKLAEEQARATRDATNPQNWYRDLPEDTEERREKRERAMMNNTACWR